MRRLLLVFLVSVIAFNGYSQSAGFLHFSVEDGLPQSQVTSLSQDHKGNLWIGTMSGASRFDGKNFKTFNSRNGLSENWVTCCSQDKKGNVWLGHWNGGISLATSNGFETRKIIIPGLAISKPITAILQVNDSLLFIGTEGNGLFRLNINANKAYRIDAQTVIKGIALKNGNLYFTTGNALCVINECSSGKSVVKKIEDGEDVSCVLSSGDNLYFSMQGHVYLYRDGSGPQQILGPEEVKNLFMDKQSRLWVATYGHGVYMFNDIQSGNFTNRVFNEKHGLNYDFANVVFQDRDQNIWIGTDLGLNILAGERISLFDKSDGIENNLVWSVLSDRDGNMYAGTGDGLFVKSNGSSEFRKVNVPSLNGRSVVTLFEDRNGLIWAGTMQGGVFVLNKEKLEKRYDSESGYPFERINRFAQQEDGSVWVATDNGAGKIDVNGKVSWHTSDNGLLSDYVTTVFVDSKDHVWFGFTGHGMQCLANNRFTIPFNDSIQTSSTILSIIEDRVGNIWAGAYGDGLFMFDGQKLKNIRLNDGTNSDSPLSLVADDKNRIWIGTNRGIDCFDPVMQRFQHFGKKRGFLGVETNINAVSRDRNGAIWFGCLLGALKLDPVDDPSPVSAPYPTIDNVQVYFKDFESKDASYSHEQNHLTFSFSSVYLKDPEKLRYQYMIEGFDSDWSPVTDLTMITYPNLPPGNYKFLVKSGFVEGIWSSPAEFHFEVKRPFWRAWWFNVILIAAITSLFMLLIEMRAKRSRKGKKQLELLVRERTIELGQKNMELARRNKELHDQLKKKSEVNS